MHNSENWKEKGIEENPCTLSIFITKTFFAFSQPRCLALTRPVSVLAFYCFILIVIDYHTILLFFLDTRMSELVLAYDPSSIVSVSYKMAACHFWSGHPTPQNLKQFRIQWVSNSSLAPVNFLCGRNVSLQHTWGRIKNPLRAVAHGLRSATKQNCPVTRCLLSLTFVLFFSFSFFLLLFGLHSFLLFSCHCCMLVTLTPTTLSAKIWLKNTNHPLVHSLINDGDAHCSYSW